jgi:hypothetical protein
VYGFDTWLANVDRNTNNILITGSTPGYLIDHGHCFSSPTWGVNDLKADRTYTNKLKFWLTPCLSDEEKNRAMADIAALTSKMARLDVAEAIQDALADRFWSEECVDGATGFLEARVANIEKLGAEALEVLV